MENLGRIATDALTGFTGTVTAYIHYLDGTSQYQLQPECDNHGNKLPKAEWFPSERVNF